MRSNLPCRVGKSCLRKLHLTPGLKNDEELIKVGIWSHGVERVVQVEDEAPEKSLEAWEQPEVTEDLKGK